MCVNSWYQYIYALFLSFFVIAAKRVSLVFLSLANAHCFLTELIVFSFSFSQINMRISYIFFIKNVLLNSFLMTKFSPL